MVNPVVSDFKSYFNRDFPYGSSLSAVMDADIQKALDDAAVNFNPNFFADQLSYTNGYLNLAAHYLVMNLRASSQGLVGQYDWLSASRGAGSVNESFSIPQHILDHPYLGMLSKTNYGAKYLSLVIPQLIGQMFTVCGATLP